MDGEKLFPPRPLGGELHTADSPPPPSLSPAKLSDLNLDSRPGGDIPGNDIQEALLHPPLPKAT